MRLLLILSAVAVLLTPQVGRAQPVPVVLELFTSQGCSSCPPADALLAELAETEGVIALALHVDYWDYLGWADAFASPAHTKRQRSYAKAARSRTIFTPEMIVQGQERLKGHDAGSIREQIAAHRMRPALASVALEPQGDALAIRVEPLQGNVGSADVHVVRFTPSQAVLIEGGENAGQEITYANVVTDWQTIAHWDGAAPLDLFYDGVGDGPVAVIVQKSRMGPIVNAARWP